MRTEVIIKAADKLSAVYHRAAHHDDVTKEELVGMQAIIFEDLSEEEKAETLLLCAARAEENLLSILHGKEPKS